MKKIILIFLALLSTNSSAEWVRYHDNWKAFYWFDSSRINTIGDNVWVWSKARFKEPHFRGNGSAIYHINIDCVEKWEQIVTRTYFKSVHWTNKSMTINIPTEKRVITSNSVQESLANIICN